MHTPSHLVGAQNQDTACVPLLPTITQCTWLDDATHTQKLCLQNSLLEAEKLVPGILAFDLAHKYLSRFCAGWNGAVQARGGWTQIPVDSFVLSVTLEMASAISTALMVERVCQNELIQSDSVAAMLTLGCGYWTYAKALSIVFPKLKQSIGIDTDPEKVRGFDEYVRTGHVLSNSTHRAVVHNMRDLPVRSTGEHANLVRQCDLIILHNPSLPEASLIDYQLIFTGISNSVAEKGRLVIFIDQARKSFDGNPALFHYLHLTGIEPTTYADRRIPRDAGRGIIESREVLVLVIERSQLARARDVEFRLVD